MSLGLVNKALIALVYGDLLMRVLYRVRPYEKVKGSAMRCMNTGWKSAKSLLEPEVTRRLMKCEKDSGRL